MTRRPHRYEVDIVRFVTFAGVIVNHCVAGTTLVTNVAANAVQMVFHYTRNAFFTLTGFVLTYQYRDQRLDPVTFWRKRFAAVGIPFLTWTVFYWLYEIYLISPPPSLRNIARAFADWDSAGVALRGLGVDLITANAWYHLYFVFVTLQVYLLFPFVLRLLQCSRGYHRYLLAVSLLVHLVLASFLAGTRPEMFNFGGWKVLWDHLYITVIPYQFFTLLGCVAAMHVDELTKFMSRFRGVVIAAALVVTALTVANYYRVVGEGTSPHAAANVFQPSTTAMFLLIIAALFALGTYWSDRRTPGSFWDRFFALASDRSFGIFLVHAFALHEFGITIERFRYDLYAPLVTAGAFVATVTLTVAITEVLRRTPLSKATTGRSMIPLAEQSLRTGLWLGGAMVVLGAVGNYLLDVPAGLATMAFGTILLLWQMLGRAMARRR